MPWKNYSTGHSKSCGKCTYVVLRDLLSVKYGLLSIDPTNDLDTPTSRNAKISFHCDCGGSKSVVLKSVLNGLTKSCGCVLNGHPAEFSNHASAYLGPAARPKPVVTNKLFDHEWWLKQDFGRLVISSLDRPIGRCSDTKLTCVCKCGNITEVRAAHLTSGATTSCGKCADRGHDWWDVKGEFDYPRDLAELLEFFAGSYLTPLEFSRKSLDVKCNLCDTVFRTRFHDLFLKKIVSCGCIKGSNSKPNREIGMLLSNAGLDVEYEHRIGKWRADIYVGSCNLFVEHHGLRYHSDELRDNKWRDLKKFTELSQNGRCIVIYSDEWLYKRQIMSNVLMSACDKLKLPAVRPQACDVAGVESATAHDFLDANHYLGATNGRHIGVSYGGELLAIMTVASPTRQSSYDFEITRMVAAGNRRIHGVWSYLLRRLPDFGINGRLVTFSENRLSTGAVYAAMGMKRSGMVAPGYCYTDNHKRYHKSALRKTKAERLTGLTERTLRAAQGLYRIYDYGKIRWEIKI